MSLDAWSVQTGGNSNRIIKILIQNPYTKKVVLLFAMVAMFAIALVIARPQYLLEWDKTVISKIDGKTIKPDINCTVH